MPVALLALALGGFGIGTTEFVIMGLLPEVAGSVHVDMPTAGHLISGYALGVVAGTPLLTALTVRLCRKHVLPGLMVLFAVANLASALAPTYARLMMARFAAGTPHGTFFGVGGIVAAGLVEPARRARAVPVMFVGLTVANIVGVPAGTFIGETMGWRWTFALVAAVGVAAAFAIVALPSCAASDRSLGCVGRTGRGGVVHRWVGAIAGGAVLRRSVAGTVLSTA